MKRLLLIFSLFVFVSFSYAQDVTKFLGIPVDGTYNDMVNAIWKKGFFGSNPINGEFNGMSSAIYVYTRTRKVFRVVVEFNQSFKEEDVISKFNELCDQFEKNPKYVIPLSYKIPAGATDLDHYEAIYFQKPDEGCENRKVWFTIKNTNMGSGFGDEVIVINKYKIFLYYDNVINQNDDSDL